MGEYQKKDLSETPVHEIVNHIVSRLMQAADDAEGFMVAVWTVKEGRLFLNDVTTKDFPTGDNLYAIRLLINQMYESMAGGVSTPVDPLPRASLFGNSKLIDPTLINKPEGEGGENDSVG